MARPDEDPENPAVSLDRPERRRWQETGESNLASARREAAAGGFHVAVFLAEQAAQCTLKGLLSGVGATARAHGHGLVALGDAAVTEAGMALPDTVREALQRLAQSYMPSRYPDALPSGSPVDHYGRSHAVQAIEDAERVMGAAQHAWEELLEADAAGDGNGPEAAGG